MGIRPLDEDNNDVWLNTVRARERFLTKHGHRAVSGSANALGVILEKRSQASRIIISTSTNDFRHQLSADISAQLPKATLETIEYRSAEDRGLPQRQPRILPWPTPGVSVESLTGKMEYAQSPTKHLGP